MKMSTPLKMTRLGLTVNQTEMETKMKLMHRGGVEAFSGDTAQFGKQTWTIMSWDTPKNEKQAAKAKISVRRGGFNRKYLASQLGLSWGPQFTDTQLLEIAKRFLTYAFVDVEFIWANLTKTEQGFCTKQEFDALVEWMKAPTPVEIPDTEEETGDMRLVYTKNNKAVKLGDKVKDFRGELHKVISMQEPQTPESTGRVYVKCLTPGTGWQQGFYPSVFGMKWVR